MQESYKGLLRTVVVQAYSIRCSRTVTKPVVSRLKIDLVSHLDDFREDGNSTRMLRAILIRYWRRHPTRQQLYGHLPLITKTIKIKRTRHAGHCWRSNDELIRDVLLWNPSHGRAKEGRLDRTYRQQLCEDTRCSLEDQPKAMNDRERWRERDIHVDGSTRRWI